MSYMMKHKALVPLSSRTSMKHEKRDATIGVPRFNSFFFQIEIENITETSMTLILLDKPDFLVTNRVM